MLSETESAFLRENEGLHYNIDVDPVPFPHEIEIVRVISPEKILNKKSQGVQVDVPCRELKALRAEVKALRLENEALKKILERPSAKTAECHVTKLSAKDKA